MQLLGNKGKEIKYLGRSNEGEKKDEEGDVQVSRILNARDTHKNVKL